VRPADPPGALHELMQDMGMDAFRVPGVFGRALPTSGDVPPHVRLLAFLGRDLRTAEPVLR
jgi:hypothetical protein